MSTAVADSATPNQSRTLKTCCTAHVVHDGLSDVSYVLLPLLAQTFDLNLAQVGVIRTAHRVAMAAFQLPAGLIAERFGERNLLALGTLLSGVAFIGLGFANGFWMILLALFFAGMGSAVQHPLFDSRWTNWVGLVTHKPVTEDYVPLLPWTGVMLLGLAAGRAALAHGGGVLQGSLPPWLKPLATLGRWPLSFYMLHQPVFIGTLMGWRWLQQGA